MEITRWGQYYVIDTKKDSGFLDMMIDQSLVSDTKELEKLHSEVSKTRKFTYGKIRRGTLVIKNETFRPQHEPAMNDESEANGVFTPSGMNITTQPGKGVEELIDIIRHEMLEGNMVLERKNKGPRTRMEYLRDEVIVNRQTEKERKLNRKIRF